MDFGNSNGVTVVMCYSGKENAEISYHETDPVTHKYKRVKIEVPFEDIYNLMKDWLKYIEEWEKETGKIKK